MTPEERKEYNRVYHKEYRLKNKEKIKERRREYYLKNKEKINEINRNNHHKNKENRNEQKREYSQTENGKKSNTIGQWKYKGVICEDFNKMYEIYINTNNCQWCDNDISEKRELEHNHYSGEVRGVVCKSCNQKIRYKDRRYDTVMKELRKDL